MGELPKIDRDESYQRDYIPLPGGWEIQTKGKGSTFRIVDTKKNDSIRWPVTDTHLHPVLERMAREVRAAYESRPTPAGEGVTEAMVERAAEALATMDCGPDAWLLMPDKNRIQYLSDARTILESALAKRSE